MYLEIVYKETIELRDKKRFPSKAQSYLPGGTMMFEISIPYSDCGLGIGNNFEALTLSCTQLPGNQYLICNLHRSFHWHFIGARCGEPPGKTAHSSTYEGEGRSGLNSTKSLPESPA